MAHADRSMDTSRFSVTSSMLGGDQEVNMSRIGGRGKAGEITVIKLTELLFPTFNSLVPQMVECILPLTGTA